MRTTKNQTPVQITAQASAAVVLQHRRRRQHNDVVGRQWAAPQLVHGVMDLDLTICRLRPNHPAAVILSQNCQSRGSSALRRPVQVVWSVSY